MDNNQQTNIQINEENQTPEKISFWQWLKNIWVYLLVGLIIVGLATFFFGKGVGGIIMTVSAVFLIPKLAEEVGKKAAIFTSVITLILFSVCIVHFGQLYFPTTSKGIITFLENLDLKVGSGLERTEGPYDEVILKRMGEDMDESQEMIDKYIQENNFDAADKEAQRLDSILTRYNKLKDKISRKKEVKQISNTNGDNSQNPSYLDETIIGKIGENCTVTLFAEKPFSIIASVDGGYILVDKPAGYSTIDFDRSGVIRVKGKDREDVKLVSQHRRK